jgi:hypothetical protein
MPARLSSIPASRAIRALLLVAILGACIPLPSPSPTPSPSVTPRPTPTTAESSPTTEPTPAPYSLGDPSATDPRLITVAVTPALPTDGSGTITVVVTNLDPTRIIELVLRWPTVLDERLFLAPFTPSTQRICDGCPPLVQPWTKWVNGPGERGEPAGTTSLGWGPLDPGAVLTIPIVVTRRVNGPVDFDLQVLEGEALLTQQGGEPAWLRVSVP